MNDFLPHLEKVIEIDYDSVVLGDIVQLYEDSEVGGGTFMIGAVKRKKRSWQPDVKSYIIGLEDYPELDKKIDGDKPAFNAGFLIWDLNMWRDQEKTEQVEKYMKLNQEKVVLFSKKWKFI